MRSAFVFTFLLIFTLFATPVHAAEEFLGTASWFGNKFHGKLTASGEPFDMFSMTAAHKQLPFGTILLVTNTNNGRQAVLRVNDRGPFSKKRILDVSFAAAGKLGMHNSGTAPVHIEVIGDTSGKPLDPESAFFIQLDPQTSPSASTLSRDTVRKELSRLFRAGVTDAGLLMHIEKAPVLGPFATFEDAHSVLMRLATVHPNSIITLMKEKEAMPVNGAVAMVK